MKLKAVFLIIFLVLIPGLVSADFEARINAPSFLGVLGIGPKTTISVTNTTPFWARLIARGDEILMLALGVTVYDQYTFEFKRTELPVMALLYAGYSESASSVSFGEFIGVASRVLRISRGQPNDWVIETRDIEYPDNRTQRSYTSRGGSPYPAPDIESGEVLKVDFPSIAFRSTTSVQFVNVTFFDVEVRIDGRSVMTLATGELRCVEIENPLYPSTRLKVHVIFSDRDRLTGHYESQFRVHTGGHPRGVQFVLTPERIERF